MNLDLTELKRGIEKEADSSLPYTAPHPLPQFSGVGTRMGLPSTFFPYRVDARDSYYTPPHSSTATPGWLDNQIDGARKVFVKQYAGATPASDENLFRPDIKPVSDGGGSPTPPASLPPKVETQAEPGFLSRFWQAQALGTPEAPAGVLAVPHKLTDAELAERTATANRVKGGVGLAAEGSKAILGVAPGKANPKDLPATAAIKAVRSGDFEKNLVPAIKKLIPESSLPLARNVYHAGKSVVEAGTDLYNKAQGGISSLVGPELGKYILPAGAAFLIAKMLSGSNKQK